MNSEAKYLLDNGSLLNGIFDRMGATPPLNWRSARVWATTKCGAPPMAELRAIDLSRQNLRQMLSEQSGGGCRGLTGQSPTQKAENMDATQEVGDASAIVPEQGEHGGLRITRLKYPRNHRWMLGDYRPDEEPRADSEPEEGSAEAPRIRGQKRISCLTETRSASRN